MSKILVWVVVLGSLLLVWCSDVTQTVFFDIFSMELKTKEKTYARIASTELDAYNFGDQLDFGYRALSDISKIKFTEEDISKSSEIEEVFVNSLLVSRIELPDDIDLQKFVTYNVEQLQISMVAYEKDGKQSEKRFICGEQEREGIVQKFTFAYGVEKEELLHFAQYFFIYNGMWYIVSFASQEESECDAFVGSLDTLGCM